MGLARIAWLLVINAGPEGMPDRFSGPLHEGLTEEGRTLEAPVDPAFLATPFRDRGKARELWPFGGGRIAVAWFATGDEEPGSEDGASAREGREHGEVGMTRGMRRDGVVKVLGRLHGGPELADEGVNEQHMGGAEALIGGPGDGRLDGVEARRENIRRAHLGLANEGFQGRAAGTLGRLQGWPAAENVTKNDRVVVLKPLERMRAIVFQGARETSGEPHVVSHHAPAVFDEWCQGTPGGALRIEGRQRVAVSAEPFERQVGVGGVLLRAAGGSTLRGTVRGSGG